LRRHRRLISLGLASSFRLGLGVQFRNNCFTEMCSGSEAGSYLRLTDFVYHPTLGLRVITKKKTFERKGLTCLPPGPTQPPDLKRGLVPGLLPPGFGLRV